MKYILIVMSPTEGEQFIQADPGHVSWGFCDAHDDATLLDTPVEIPEAIAIKLMKEHGE